MKLNSKKHIHFIGIGGIGMSAIALVLRKMGHKVTGSDVKSSRLIEKIRTCGGEVFLGHNEKNINGADIVVFSSSITAENPELKSARDKKIATLHRAEMLALLMNGKKGIAVTGAHGKTTTTSLISHILFRAKLDPTAILGGEVASINGNAVLGRGDYFVVEADESDGSFVHLEPFYCVITNIDEEHLDYYRNIREIMSSYMKFIEKIRRGGRLFACGDCDNIKRALRAYEKDITYFGLSKGLDIYPEDIKMHEDHTEFSVVYNGDNLGRAALNIPGIHNVSNAMAAFAVALQIGLDFKTIKDTVEDFRGAERRFQRKYCKDGISIIDDYAHHPAEIKATILAAKNWNPKRLVVLFQPHRYSRTKYLKERFGRCFDLADHLVITDIYAASEEPIEGVSGKDIYEETKSKGHKSAIFLSRRDVKEYLLNYVRLGDMVLVLGAGDVTSVAEELAKELSVKRQVK
ncbi:MAG: UDP-N-acetylmuramate--L-alanine ligase [Candidatus Omnitrophota bacterium]